MPGVRPTLGRDPPAVNNISAGDVHLAAWQDFYYCYVFLSKADTAVQVSAWVSE